MRFVVRLSICALGVFSVASAQTLRIVDDAGRPVATATIVLLLDEYSIERIQGPPQKATVIVPVLDRHLIGDGAVESTDSAGQLVLPKDHAFGAAVAISGDRCVEIDLRGIRWDSVKYAGLAPFRKVLTLGADGKPLPGVSVAYGRLWSDGGRSIAGNCIAQSDASGLAVIPDLAGGESWTCGAIWVAPAGDPLSAPWSSDPTRPCVMQLPPCARVEIENCDGGGGRLSVSGTMRHRNEFMRERTAVYRYVPTGTQFSADLLDHTWSSVGSDVAFVPAPGRVLRLRLREKLDTWRVTGRIDRDSAPQQGLALTTAFIDWQEGEKAAETVVRDDGSFAFDLLSRRPPAGRDIRIYLRDPGETDPTTSRFRTVRKRLSQPDVDGSISIGTFQAREVEPRASGVVIDTKGTPVPHAVIEFGRTHCVGDPRVPIMPGWPYIAKADEHGRFNLFAARSETFFFLSLRGDGSVTPSEIAVPATDVRVVAVDQAAVPVEIDCGLAFIKGYDEVTLVFEARREERAGRTDPVVIRQTKTVGESWAATESWGCIMELEPGSWRIGVRTRHSSTLIGEVRDVVVPRDASRAEPYLKVMMPVTNPLKVIELIVSASTGGADLSVLSLRYANGAPWVRSQLWRDGRYVTAIVDDTIDVALNGAGFRPVTMTVRPGQTSIRLEEARRTPIFVTVPEPPGGAEQHREWWATLTLVGELAAPASREVRSFGALPRESVWRLVTLGTPIELPAYEPGTYRVQLIGGGLIYASKEIHIRGDESAARIDCPVDPESQGMAPLVGLYE